MKDRLGKKGEHSYGAEVQELIDRHSLEELAALVDVVREYYRQCVRALDQKKAEQQRSKGHTRKVQGPVAKGKRK